MQRKKGFTLIELLIVVAIIAILAAIAVPNFLEAQVRSKVSRVKSELRTIATGIEAYAVDHNRVPRMLHTDYYGDKYYYNGVEHDVYGCLWQGITTPIAYLTRADWIDPFQNQDTAHRLDERFYSYHDIKVYADEIYPTSAFWDAALVFYGAWRVGSVGPDKSYGHGFPASAQLVYDPTNGTISLGNIWRSQNHSDDIQPPVGVLLGAH